MRTVLSRIFLIALLGVAVYAVVSLSSGSSRPPVALEGLDPDDLAHDAFALDQPGTFAIDAAGSFEEAGTPASDTTLAAYGWIVRREDGAVAWQMRAQRPGRGTLVLVRDTIRLGPGTYDAYFTAHGDPLVRAPGPRDASFRERVRSFLSRGGRSWVGDAGRWRLLVSALDQGGREARSSGIEDPAAAAATDSAVVWQTLGVRNRSRREAILQVTAPARVAVRAVTEITGGVVADRASLVRLGSRDTVWSASGDGTWAGGSLKNRVVESEVDLEPGFYRAIYEADRSHAYRGWTANPPLVPWSWGMTVRRATPDAAVSRLDPAAVDLPEIVAFDCVGPDARREATITLPTPTDVLLVAVGEIDSGSRYDYAELERREDEDGDWDEVWEMEDDLEGAGGARKNKRAVAALSLDPGTYRLTYRTDSSHDCQSGYNNGGGPTASLWGAALYALDADLDLDAITVHVNEPAAPPSSSGVIALALPDPAGLLARIDSVGNDEDRRVRFRLAEPADVTVVAQGEISEQARYDFATIERPDGDEVWEMTWENTAPGGSSLYHRRFEGTVRLEAGTYVLHYETDGSRSFGDFGPDSEVLWGVHVYGPEDGRAPPPPPPVPPMPATDA